MDGFWESHTLEPTTVLQRSRQGKHWENPSPAETNTHTMLHHRLVTMTLADKSNIVFLPRRFGFLLASLLLVSSPADGQGGFGNFIHNLFRPIMRLVQVEITLVGPNFNVLNLCVADLFNFNFNGICIRPLNNFLRPINFGLRDIFHFGPRTNAAFR